MEGYQLGMDTDLLPVEPSVASGVFINVHRWPPIELSVTTSGLRLVANSEMFQKKRKNFLSALQLVHVILKTQK